ncbi:MAG: ComEC/Rec2 family competence protein [bacterium]|nr:ComEC/Rec2 family competence protein [bacterium]
MKSFSSIPFLRLSLPFITGILLAISTGIDVELWYMAAFLLVAMVIRLFPTNQKQKRTYLFTLDVFLFFLGAALIHYTDVSKKGDFYGNYIKSDSSTYFIGVINDVPIPKKRSVKCSMNVLGVKSGTKYVPTSGSVLVYFKRSQAALALKPGSTVFMHGKFQAIQAPMNPNEFDYKTYLQRKQIFHTIFLDSTSFVFINNAGILNPIWEAGLSCKSLVLKKLKNSQLSFEAYSICAALLTGYDDDIEKPVMDAFSHSGTLHVLSVSGLHTGLIYLVLNYLFNLIDTKQRKKTARFLFITISLWGFALLAGFSAPVLRAVIMFNLMGLGKIYFRNSSRNQLNVLLVSAFMLLSYNPWWMTDVGFLLSYFAMIGLIYFQPKLSGLLHPDNAILKYIWLSVTASFSATLSTLPITLLLFKTFPIWFFICNLVVVPVTFAVLLLAVLVVINISGVPLLINYLISSLIFFIHLFDSKKGGYIDMIDFTNTDAIFLSLLIVVLSGALRDRSYKHAALGLLLVLAWQLTALCQSYLAKEQKLITLYQIKNGSTVSIKNKDRTTLVSSTKQGYEYSVKPHLITFNYNAISNKTINYIELNNEAIFILDSTGFWPRENIERISTLILINNSRLHAAELLRFKNLRLVVSDGSNNRSNCKNTEELCRKFGLGFYDTKREGAFLLSFK